MYQLGLIGCGNMGEAMLAGALAAGQVTGDQVILHTRRAERMAELQGKYTGVRTAASNAEVAAAAKLVVLAVKPVLYPQVLSEIRGQLQAGAALLAIAPAFSIRKVCSLLGREEVAVVRAMPNTPALIGCGVTGVAFAGDTAPAVRTSVLSFLGSFGEVVEVDESLMPAVGSIGGSSPAFVYMMIEAMVQGGIKLGLPAEQAVRFAAGTLEGTARMVQRTGQHPAVLRDAVCSAGGTTIAGVASLEKSGFNGAVMTAMEASAERFREMQALSEEL